MYRKILPLLCGAWVAFAQSPAPNLLHNAEFSELGSSGLPVGWTLRGSADHFQPVSGGATLRGADGLFLIQSLPDLPTGRNYDLTCRVGGTGQCRVYVEWRFLEGGEKKFRSSGARAIPLDGGTREKSVKFLLPENALSPYLAINVPAGATATVTGLTLREVIPELIANADFRQRGKDGLPLHWNLNGKKEHVAFADGVASLQPPPRQSVFLIQNCQRAWRPGAKYRLTATVSGNPGTEYRLYTESRIVRKGKRVSQAIGGNWRQLHSVSEKASLEFTLPVSAISPLLVLNARDGAIVTFAELQMAELAPPPPDAVPEEEDADFSGPWQASAGVTVTKEQLTMDGKVSTKRAIANLKPGQRYEITFLAQARTLVQGESNLYYTIQVRFADGTLAAPVRDDTWSANFQAKRYQFTATAAEAEVLFASESPQRLILKEWQLRRLEANAMPKARIELELYRDMLFSTMPTSVVSARAIPAETADGCTVVFRGKELAVRKEGRQFLFELAVAGLPTGKHEVNATFALPDGRTERASRTITALPPAPVEVTVGRNRFLHVNGTPVLPNGLWSLGNLESRSHLEYAARCGNNFSKFNCADAGKMKQLLDLAESYGMKLVWNCQYPKDETEGEYRTWAHQVESVLRPEILRHPALLGYFLRDEPWWCGYPCAVLVRCYERLKELDPYRPVWINAAPRGTIADQEPYARACDIYGVDIYPVPEDGNHSHLEDKGVSCVGKYTQRQSQIAGGRKPIAMALQGFAWADCQHNKKEPVYPTLSQVRFMAFDALLNGANMVAWWGTYCITRPDFYGTLFTVIDEVSRLTPVLLGEASPRCETDGVEYRLYTGRGYALLLAANTVGSEREVALGVASPGQFREFYGGAPLTRGARGLQISLPAHGVGVYVEGSLPSGALRPPASHEGSPFAEEVANLLHAVPYDGSASWIWDEAGASQRGSKTVVRKRFQAAAGEQVTLIACADDYGEVWFNGVSAGALEGFQFMRTIDLTSQARQGENILEIRGTDSGAPPCGILAEIRVGDRVYPSGTDWEAAAYGSSEWHPAFLVTPFGSGAWGKAVKYRKPEARR
ncbi:MAG: hypothetical protein IJJ33_04760 [Victivallales bacterium]|nr:hypothetical protein [Victivallales bacterium]